MFPLQDDSAPIQPKQHPGAARRLHRSLLGETLESRQLFSITSGPQVLPIEPFDGVANNLQNPTFGSAGVDLLRIAPAAYADGVSSPAGDDRPSARAISEAIFAQEDGIDILNDRDLSAFVYAWGQFLDHDLDLTLTGSIDFDILVPAGDPAFDPAGTGTQYIPLKRSVTNPATGTDAANPAQQVNAVTAFIDGSMVYGSDAEHAASLRAFSGGLLRTSADKLLPYSADDPANSGMFVAGDIRVNENVELTSLHTLFVREHNRQAAILAAAHPNWTDEQLYQAARAVVIAEIQSITYNEFLPALLGDRALPRYRGYDPGVNPGITSEFSTAAYRFGHSTIGNDVEFLDNNGKEIADEVSLAEAFFNPGIIVDMGIDAILKYLASSNMQEIDTKVVASLRNFLFGQPGQGGLDLAALNIQRGRDHGLASYNETRIALGLPAAESFADVTDDAAVQAALASVYESVDQIDLWVGGLAELHLPHRSMGSTFTAILVDQFLRLRDGDRFFYANQFSGTQLRAIQSTTLVDIIARNTTTTNLQRNVFVFATAIQGQITAGRGRDAVRLAGQVVNLLDESGAIVATATTNKDGRYVFEHVELGNYTIQLADSPARTKAVSVTRGQTINGIDFELPGLLSKPDRQRVERQRSKR